MGSTLRTRGWLLVVGLLLAVVVLGVPVLAVLGRRVDRGGGRLLLLCPDLDSFQCGRGLATGAREVAFVLPAGVDWGQDPGLTVSVPAGRSALGFALELLGADGRAPDGPVHGPAVLVRPPSTRGRSGRTAGRLLAPPVRAEGAALLLAAGGRRGGWLDPAAGAASFPEHGYAIHDAAWLPKDAGEAEREDACLQRLALACPWVFALRGQRAEGLIRPH